MNDQDRRRWDAHYTQAPPASLPEHLPLPVFSAYIDQFPVQGHCLELACGQGEAAVWLARRGLSVVGVDVSPVAIARARELAADAGVQDRCRFEAFSLDDGLPEGEPVDLLLCHNFRDTLLYGAIVHRLKPGGMLAISTLSEVDAQPGRFRAKPGELLQAFAGLDILNEGEKAGKAWLVGRRP